MTEAAKSLMQRCGSTLVQHSWADATITVDGRGVKGREDHPVRSLWTKFLKPKTRHRSMEALATGVS